MAAFGGGRREWCCRRQRTITDVSLVLALLLLLLLRLPLRLLQLVLLLPDLLSSCCFVAAL